MFVLQSVVALAVATLCVQGYPKYVAIPLEDLKNYGLVVQSYEQQPSIERRSLYEGPETLNYDPEMLNVDPERLNVDPERLNIDPERRNSDYHAAESAPFPEFVSAPLHDERPKRQSGYGDHHGGGDDHVDYGAYTGGHGAFGWYSDHPVLSGGKY